MRCDVVVVVESNVVRFGLLLDARHSAAAVSAESGCWVIERDQIPRGKNTDNEREVEV
jgi:hypothetical protein